MLGLSLSSCCRYHPAEVGQPCQSAFGRPCCLRPRVAGSAFGIHCRGHLCVHSRYGPMTRNLPKGDLVDRFQKFGFPRPCDPSYGAPDYITPAGLSPAEPASLRWTHNPACRFPALGFPVVFVSRFMWPFVPGVLSADRRPGTVRTARAGHKATAYSTFSSRTLVVRAVASCVVAPSARPSPSRD